MQAAVAVVGYLVFNPVSSGTGGDGRATRWADEIMPAQEPPICEVCGAPRVRIRWGSACYSPKDVDDPDVQSGLLILGNQIDRDRDPPEYVCTACEPRWLDVHELVVRDCQLQTAKEDAIEAQEFDKARQMRDLQFDFRPKLNAMVDELLAE